MKEASSSCRIGVDALSVDALSDGHRQVEGWHV